MRALSLWMRAHPTVGDGLGAALLAVVDLAGGLSLRQLDTPAHAAHYLVGSVLLIGPLVVRRRWPLGSALVVLLGLLHLGLTLPEPSGRVGEICLCAATFTLIGRHRRRVAFGYVLAATLAWAWVAGTDSAAISVDVLAMRTLVFVLAAATAWFAGEFVTARRAYQAELELRVHQLELDREQRARIAVAEEHNRIARELHDVLAHSVSIMITQADGAGYALRTAPETAERALRTIASTGRGALDELRTLLALLRAPGQDDAAPGATTSTPWSRGSARSASTCVSCGTGTTLPARRPRGRCTASSRNP